jgi:hypothetical protein
MRASAVVMATGGVEQMLVDIREPESLVKVGAKGKFGW